MDFFKKTANDIKNIDIEAKISSVSVDELIHKTTNKKDVFAEKNLLKEEAEYMKNRKLKIKKALSKLLSVDEDKIKTVPTISIASSGGGVRAMTATIGSLCALQKSGIWDCISYYSGLSGSTWAITPYLHRGEKSFDDYCKFIHEKIQTSFMVLDDVKGYDLLAKMILKRTAQGFKVSLVDIYGFLLGYRLFGNQVINNRFSHIAGGDLMKGYDVPYPILSAIYVKLLKDSEDFTKWWEFTPYYSGINSLDYYIKTEDFGCKFYNFEKKSKESKDYSDYLLGICGSAFEVTMDRLFAELCKAHPQVKPFLSIFMNKSDLTNVKMDPPLIRNLAYYSSDKKIGEYKTIQLVDAGIKNNLPVHPVLRKARQADILIIFDNGYPSPGTKFGELKGILEYCKENELPFPKVDVDGLEKDKPFHVIKGDPSKGIPTVIYYPLVRSKGDDYEDMPKDFPLFKTSKLDYNKKESKALSSLTKSHMEQSEETLIDIIKSYALN